MMLWFEDHHVVMIFWFEDQYEFKLSFYGTRLDYHSLCD